jgi:ABC-2 type transport system ATP-binding protein
LTEEIANKFRGDDFTVSFKNGRLIADIPDSAHPGEMLDAIRAANGDIVSVIPRRKRLEDLFLESVAGDNVLKGRKMSKMTDDHNAAEAVEVTTEEGAN